MAVIVISYGKVARRALRYPKADKQNNGPGNPRVLRSTGVNVAIEGAERVFARLRRKHKSRGAQTLQTIVSFSKAEMNPDDPADHERAMQLLVVIAMFALPPGTPSVIYLQADGKTGCLHGHIVSCTTLPQDCELDGVKWKAGRKLAGAWTEIEAYRKRCNEAMAEAGFVNELQHVAKPDVQYTKFESGIRLRQADFDERAARGELKEDEVRPEQSWRIDLAERLVRCSVEDARSVTEDGLKAAVLDAGSEVRERVSKSGHVSWLFRRPGADSWIRGKTLGAFFVRENMLDNVELRSKGLEPRRPTPRQVEKRPDKELPEVTAEQVHDARNVMARMVAEEQARAGADELHEWLWDRINDVQLAGRSDAMARWQEYGESFLDDEDMARLHELMDTWKVEQATQHAAQSAANQAAYEAARKARLSPRERAVDDLATRLGLPDDQAVWDELRDVVMTHSPALLADDDEDRWVEAHLGDVDVNAVLRRAGMPVIGDGDAVAAGHIGFGSLGAEDAPPAPSEPTGGREAGDSRVENGLRDARDAQSADRDAQLAGGSQSGLLGYEDSGSRRDATGTASKAGARNAPAGGQEAGYESPSNGRHRANSGQLGDPVKRSVAELEAELVALQERQTAELQARLDAIQRNLDQVMAEAGLADPVDTVEDESEHDASASAPAATGSGQTSAPAAARPTGKPAYRCPLHDAVVENETPKQKRERLAMAKFDDYAYPQLLAGKRIDDKRVPRGITHDKLAHWKAHGLSAETHQQMSLRTTKYELSRFEHDVGQELKQEMALFTPGEPGYTVRAAELKVSNARKDRLRAEVAAGVYEDLEGGGSGGGGSGSSGSGNPGTGPGSGAGIETPVPDDKEYGG